MTTRVAFLRAVNLGKRTVKMASLVEIAEGLGYEGVWTHINSGNVVFDATGSRGELERAFEKALEAALGFEVTTFVRTAAELRRAIALEPFVVACRDTYFLTLLKVGPTPAKRRALEALTNASTPSWSRGGTSIGGCTASRPIRSCGRRTGKVSWDGIGARAAT